MRRTTGIAIATIIILSLSFSGSTPALSLSPQSPGSDLDPSFGLGGKVLTQLSEPWRSSAMALQSDGDIVMLGVLNPDAEDASIVLVRYRLDGRIDQSFGSGGIVEVPLPYRSSAGGIETQTDGKILIAGGMYMPATNSYTGLVARLLPNGALDPSFGTGGYLTVDFGGYSFIRHVRTLPDGRIVAVGVLNGTLALARLLSDGTFDESFGQHGISLVEGSGSPLWGTELTGVALQVDGTMIGSAASSTSMQVAKLTADGRPDVSFGEGGIARVYVDFCNGSASSDIAQRVAVRPSGRIVVAGASHSFCTPSGTRLVLMQFLADGEVDSSFGVNGRALAQVGQWSSIVGLSLDIDGSICVGATIGVDETHTQFAVVRFLPGGLLDASYGTSGAVHADFAEPDVGATSFAVQQDGRLIVGGAVSNDGVGIARFPRPTPPTYDYCIQGDHTGDLVQVNVPYGAYTQTNCASGNVTSGHAVATTVGRCKVRLTSDDSIRMKITVNDCRGRAKGTINDVVTGAKIRIDDDNLSDDSCGCR